MDTLLDDFQALPEAIKNWFASDHTTTAIAEINKKLGIKEARRSIIPGLVLRLIVRDLEPRDFINELSGELKINYPTAKAITVEIETKVLRPIEAGLLQDAGVDVKLIYSGPAPTAPTAQTPIKVIIETPATPIQKPISSVIPQPQTQIKKEVPLPAAPFQGASPTPQKQEPEQPGIAPRLLYKERTLGPNLPPKFQPPESPVSVKPISSRIVNYIGAVTSLNSSELEEKDEFDSFVVDLRTS